MFSQKDQGSRLGSAARREGCGADSEPVHDADICSDAIALPRSTSLLSEISLARSGTATLQRFRTSPAGSGGSAGPGVPTRRECPTGPRPPSVPGTGSQLCRAAGADGRRAPHLATGHHPRTPDTIPGSRTQSLDPGHHPRIQGTTLRHRALHHPRPQDTIPG